MGITLSLYVLLITGIVNVFIIYKNIGHIKNKAVLIDEILELCIKDIWKGESGNYRSNVMMLNNEKMLQVKYSSGMRLHADKSLTLEIGKGTSGIAFANGRPVIGDLSKYGHSAYSIEPDTEKLIWPEMKSIYSLPIFNTISKKNETIGVFNIDSSIEINNCGFMDPTIQNQLRCFGSLLSSLLSDEY